MFHRVSTNKGKYKITQYSLHTTINAQALKTYYEPKPVVGVLDFLMCFVPRSCCNCLLNSLHCIVYNQ